MSIKVPVVRANPTAQDVASSNMIPLRTALELSCRNCCNCKQEHLPFSSIFCPYYAHQRNIYILAAVENLSFLEARSRLKHPPFCLTYMDTDSVSPKDFPLIPHRPFRIPV